MILNVIKEDNNLYTWQKVCIYCIFYVSGFYCMQSLTFVFVEKDVSNFGLYQSSAHVFLSFNVLSNVSNENIFELFFFFSEENQVLMWVFDERILQDPFFHKQINRTFLFSQQQRQHFLFFCSYCIFIDSFFYTCFVVKLMEEDE